jgi:YYY domain-containing protein
MSVHDIAKSRRESGRRLIFALLLAVVLAAGAYLRVRGLFWGEYQYLHPDERFLVMVGSSISPVKSLSEYWNTAVSTLNPNNVGHGLYVYGTLPMFLTRYLVQAIYGHSGLNEMTNVGRSLSALFDVGTLLLVYYVAKRLYDRRVGVLAAAFSAFAVLQIQQSHFFTMDTFTTFFSMLTIYFVVRVADEKTGAGEKTERDSEHTLIPEAEEPPTDTHQLDSATNHALRITHYAARTTPHASRFTFHASSFISHPLFTLTLAFALALGMAMASKINAGPLAFLLPVALLIRLYRIPAEEQKQQVKMLALYLGLAAAVSFLVFRIFQPYAFAGPGFFGLRLNPQWLDNLRTLRDLVSGDIGFPPNVQWVDRPVWFSWQNMVLWGLGLPLGLLAWIGFLWAGWRIWDSWRKGEYEWQHHLLLWGWTGFYFTWQSLPNNPTMRYQLLVYPTLAIFGAWAVVHLWDWHSSRTVQASRFSVQKVSAILIGGFVLIATGAYAFGFSSIYVRPITRIAASRWIYQNIPGPIDLQIQSGKGEFNQPLSFPQGLTITAEQPFNTSFTAQETGTLTAIRLEHVVDQQAASQPKTLGIKLRPVSQDLPAETASITADFASQGDSHAGEYVVSFNQPVAMIQGEVYSLEVSTGSQDSVFTLQGTTIANEGAWDDPLPVRIDGYDGFGGIYQGLNFDMYEPDNPQKSDRFLNILDQADYILISSSRQWGSLPRVPQRYPMNSEYYRSLIGCPPERSVEWCYNIAGPGDFQGQLGYDLIQVFQSNPKLGPIEINDQASEEAFTVYDHPKVFIFKKRPDYDPQQVRSILGSVDLSTVVSDPASVAPVLTRNMMLPSDRLAIQRLGGTWSSLFDAQSLANRFPLIDLVLWYLVIGLLGLLTYPLARIALSGLPDRGYPLSRTAGLLISSYVVWVASSFKIPFSRLTISVVLALLAVLGLYLAYRQRGELRQEWRQRKGYFLFVEALFLALFILDVLIRVGNPDLWHPWKGGEKPMDFSFFNAVLKSTTFPPYDPWFAGGYINYYYYGFVLVGVLVKWLGIVPSIAYNLIIPTIFALIALGAFSIGWNLLAHRGETAKDPGSRFTLSSSPLWVGLAAMLGTAILGNLGTLRMIYQGFQKLAAPGGAIEGANILTQWGWAIRGFVQSLLGTPLPYNLADWYWNPSRAIPAPNSVEPITEFPFFTVLYGDPHAHLFAIPLTLLALAWALSIVLGRAWSRRSEEGRPSFLKIGWGFLFGGLAIGVLRPTNTWDLPTYLALGVVAIAYAIWRNYYPAVGFFGRLSSLSARLMRLVVLLGGVILLVALSVLLFQPFAIWYVQGYTAFDFWKGPHTPFWSYLTHWGVFLFVIVSWMLWETREWMAVTPISALRKLAPYRGLIYGGVVILLIWIALLLAIGVSIAWLVLPLAIWAGILILRPGQTDAKRAVLFMIGTGLVLTLMVEVIVLRGDIERMNTVFKFYLQTWTLFAVSGAAAFGWLLIALPAWLPGWRNAWQLATAGLVACAAMYPLMGSAAKIEDRMAPDAPHTLDGMAFMNYATYDDLNTSMDLSQDYRAIHWMQENVLGSPVIVEGNMVEYHWATRFTIYTGLPNVVGWNWHERQQRGSVPGEIVALRIGEVNEFYLTPDVNRARRFLQKYEVRYIIVGQLERALYPGPGLDKFENQNGVLWREVYREGSTVIYEVMEAQHAAGIK